MKKIKTLGLVLAMAGMMAMPASAAKIVGGISLAGGYTVDTADLNTADAFTSFTDVIVASRGGNYIPLIAVGTPVAMTPFSFDPFPGIGVTPLWVTTAGPFAGFNLASPISVDQPGDNTLELRGYGTLFLVGYDPTPGSWVFTANQGGGSFSFSSSNTALPDGGTTAMLLGGVLSALAFIRRKI